MTMRTISRVSRRRWLSLLLSGVLASAVHYSLGAATADRRVAVAAKAGNLATVKQLIAARVDVNGADLDGSVALLWSAYHNDLEMTRVLLAARAKVDAANAFGVTPLLQAASTGDAAVMDL